jgi:RimJ/RimL family protein N-acetyltransferase
MPRLTEPVIDRRRLAGLEQPSIVADWTDLVLRPWTRRDLRQLVRAFADSDIQRWHLWFLTSETEAAGWVDGWHRKWEGLVGASWAVSGSRRPDVVLGQVGFRSLWVADGLAELSCWTVPEHRRRQHSTNATRLLATWAFDVLGLQRLELIHSIQNPIPCRTALNAGFRVEGVKRSLQQHQDGFHDMHLHSRVRGDA